MQFLVILISATILANISYAYPVTEEPKYFIKEDLDITRPNEPPKTRMNVDRSSYRVWPWGVVPYVISDEYKQSEKDVILIAMWKIESVSCVRFRPRNNENDYIIVTPDYKNGFNCYSFVGRQGFGQVVKMQGSCVRDSAMLHELMHAIGFGHENQRPDARNYIEILRDNIDPEYYSRAYQPYSAADYSTGNKPYDFYSITHYPDYAYAKSWPLKTMRSINPTGIDLSYERSKLSAADVQMINDYYRCR